MENLTKKDMNKIIGKVTKALNKEDELLVVLTSTSTTVKGSVMDILASIMEVLDKIKNNNILGKMAVKAMFDSLLDEEDKQESQEETLKAILEDLLKSIEENK